MFVGRKILSFWCGEEMFFKPKNERKLPQPFFAAFVAKKLRHPTEKRNLYFKKRFSFVWVIFLRNLNLAKFNWNIFLLVRGVYRVSDKWPTKVKAELKKGEPSRFHHVKMPKTLNIICFRASKVEVFALQHSTFGNSNCLRSCRRANYHARPHREEIFWSFFFLFFSPDQHTEWTLSAMKKSQNVSKWMWMKSSENQTWKNFKDFSYQFVASWDQKTANLTKDIRFISDASNKICVWWFWAIIWFIWTKLLVPRNRKLSVRQIGFYFKLFTEQFHFDLKQKKEN